MLKIETVFIYSLLHPGKNIAMWLQAWGLPMVTWRVFLNFFSPVTELKKEIILLTSDSCFLFLAAQMNYFHMLLSENEFGHFSLVFGSLSSFFLFICLSSIS